MAIIRPTSDLVTGGWTSSPSGTLASCIDETTASDADYIEAAGAGKSCIIALGSTSDPGNDNNHKLRYRASSTGETLNVDVVQMAPAIWTSKQPWRRQPQGAVGIDWGNVLTNKLCHATIGFRDIVTNSFLTRNNQLVRATNHGIGLYSPSNTAIGAKTKSSLYTSNGNGTGDFTIFFYGAPIASSTKSIPVSSSDALGGGAYEPYLLINMDASYASVPGLLTFTLSGVGSASINGAIDGNLKLFAGVRSNGVYSVYANRMYSSGSTNTATIYRSTMKFCVGAYVISSAYGANEYCVILAGAFNRALSQAEIIELSNNPWQIFRPLKKVSYFDVPNVIATRTPSLTSTPSDQTIDLTSGEAATITDYSKLALRFRT